MCTSSGVQRSNLSVRRFFENEFFVADERAPFGISSLGGRLQMG